MLSDSTTMSEGPVRAVFFTTPTESEMTTPREEIAESDESEDPGNPGALAVRSLIESCRLGLSFSTRSGFTSRMQKRAQ